MIRDSGFQALRNLNVKNLFPAGTNATVTKYDISARKRHMSIIQRCHFQLTGEKQFDLFVARLGEFIDHLWRICSELQAEKIERALLLKVAENDDVTTLQQVSKVYGDEAEKRRRKGQRYQGYDLVREAADFKARVHTLSSDRAYKTSKRRRSGVTNPFLLSANYLDARELTYKHPHWQFADGKATLAATRDYRLVHYVEWKSYANGKDEYDSEAEDNIMELADLFGLENRPKALQVLPFIGIFRPEGGLRFGLVFQPPSYIENVDRQDERERGISKPRLPHTLLEHLEQGTGILPLGERFNMARKLARSFLGTVLLEIGFWQSLRTFHEAIMSTKNDVKDVEAPSRYFSASLIRLAKKELPGQVGQNYTDAVTACLSIGDNENDASTREKLCWKVCAVLDQCRV
ncbi:MAG: hypothetical protein Q9208_003330 [Pyrenodesmia sp. 3 TL-2023]